jgi:hypothetical protein
MAAAVENEPKVFFDLLAGQQAIESLHDVALRVAKSVDEECLKPLDHGIGRLYRHTGKQMVIQGLLVRCSYSGIVGHFCLHGFTTLTPSADALDYLSP